MHKLKIKNIIEFLSFSLKEYQIIKAAVVYQLGGVKWQPKERVLTYISE